MANIDWSAMKLPSSSTMSTIRVQALVDESLDQLSVTEIYCELQYCIAPAGDFTVLCSDED
jgi:hypothetical protein